MAHKQIDVFCEQVNYTRRLSILKEMLFTYDKKNDVATAEAKTVSSLHSSLTTELLLFPIVHEINIQL